ncbi:hypothetical protein Q7A53_06275 [Halobacillus rhizosphaerae]|uniref:hypothetical protein n=1 Tax=Halobacillus rhizosphaerae TaxID=3064889 RepID=UPI00398B0ADA
MNHNDRERNGLENQTIGVCPCCVKNVYENQLFVEDQNIYHFYCYNMMKAEEENE